MARHWENFISMVHDIYRKSTFINSVFEKDACQYFLWGGFIIGLKIYIEPRQEHKR